jgi:hypothetical protein
MLGKLLLLAGAALWMAAPPGNTAKTRNIEDRLNTAMPRIPWPQTYDGPAGNSSYPYGQYTSQSSNNSWPTGAGVSGTDQGWASNAGTIWTSNQGSGTVEPWPHAHLLPNHSHTIYHSHNLGTLIDDFNALRGAHSELCSQYNNHVGDYQGLVDTFNVLRADHSNLLNEHNGLMFRLNASGILQ